LIDVEFAGDIDDAFFFVPSLDLPSIPLPSFAASTAATCIQRVFRGNVDKQFLTQHLKQRVSCRARLPSEANSVGVASSVEGVHSE
jgi:hypothetical protein